MLLDSLRFGALDAPRMAHLVDGVVRGIGDYGNCVGVPTVGGEVDFHPSYNGNILVNAMCVGVARADRIFYGRASGPGNRVVYLGSKTGRDGIHGATMASDVFDETASAKRPTVQVGDPFTEKLLIECCLELMDAGLVVGIQDMGAAGLTSSAFEMAARAGCGLTLDLAKVPAREQGMTPYELMLSESQERMLLVATPGNVAPVLEACRRWGLDAVEIGTVIPEPEVMATFGGLPAFRLPVAPLVDDAPRYERPSTPPVPAAAVTLPPCTTGTGPPTCGRCSRARCSRAPGRSGSSTTTRWARARWSVPAPTRRCSSSRARASASPPRPTATPWPAPSTRSTARRRPWPRPCATSRAWAPSPLASPTASTSGRRRTPPSWVSSSPPWTASPRRAARSRCRSFRGTCRSTTRPRAAPSCRRRRSGWSGWSPRSATGRVRAGRWAIPFTCSVRSRVNWAAAATCKSRSASRPALCPRWSTKPSGAPRPPSATWCVSASPPPRTSRTAVSRSPPSR